jgi:anti-anti-sigma factor
MSSRATLALHGALTIAHGAAQRELLLEAIRPPGAELVLDLSAVEAFDSAGVQLLLATRRSLAERGDALRIVAASPAVNDALAHFGLQHLLRDARAA